MACDPFWNRTVLACHFDGSNGSTTFTDEKGNTLTANGGAQIDTGQSKFGGASLFVDGNAGSYVSSSIAGADITATDATVEAYVYVTAWDTYSYFVSRGDIGGRSWAVGVRQTALDFYWFNGGDAMVSASVSLSLNTWYHVAAVKYGTTVMLFLDGVLKGSGTVASMASGTGTLRIGSFMGYTGISHCLRGWIDDLRITKFARYVGEFTPGASAFVTNQCTISDVVYAPNGTPAKRLVRLFRRDTAELVGLTVSDATTGAYAIPTTHTGEHFVLAHDGTPVDPHSASVKLALRMAGGSGATTFDDDAGHSTAANGGVMVVEGAFPYNYSAAYFGGSGGYISCAYSTDYELGSDDFTVEFWFKVPNVSGQKTMFAFQSDFHIGVFLNGNRMNCFASSNGSSWDIMSGDSGGTYGAGNIDVTAGVWHHFAWTRSGTTWTMWIDGKLDRRLTGFSGTVFTRSEALNIGRWGNAGYWMNGYIKDFRLTKGVARYSMPFALPLPDFTPHPSGGTENAAILDMILPA